MPDQQQNRVRAMLKENRSLKSEAKEAKMLEKSPPKGLQPANTEAASKKNRGRPFQRGNPGRPRGSKNRTTRLLEELVAGEGEKLAQKAVELALAGNVKCLQMCLDRLMPRRAGRPLDFTLPASQRRARYRASDGRDHHCSERWQPHRRGGRPADVHPRWLYKSSRDT
jgi:uncharacterized protein DUF5681